MLAGIESEELLINHSAPSVWGLFARRQLVLSEWRVFKWRTTEVPSDGGSLSLKYVNMWDCPFFINSIHNQLDINWFK